MDKIRHPIYPQQDMRSSTSLYYLRTRDGSITMESVDCSRIFSKVDNMPMDKIIKGLYVGGIMDATDEEQLKKNNITHILSIHDHEHIEMQGKTYHYINAEDHPDQPLRTYFTESIDFIHKSRLDGKNVLVHCLGGISRSVTLVVAYLMTVTTLDWKDCLQVVRKNRKWANPNPGFQVELQTFQEELLQEEKKRIQKFTHSKVLDDDQECQQLLNQ